MPIPPNPQENSEARFYDSKIIRDAETWRIARDAESQLWQRLRRSIVISTAVIATMLAALGISSRSVIDGLVTARVESTLKRILEERSAYIDGVVAKAAEEAANAHAQSVATQQDASELAATLKTIEADLKTLLEFDSEDLKARVSSINALVTDDPENIVNLDIRLRALQDGQRQVQIAKVPIGSIVAWHRLPGRSPPDGWVPCNGQQVIDERSPLNGIATPNLNVANGKAVFFVGRPERQELSNPLPSILLSGQPDRRVVGRMRPVVTTCTSQTRGSPSSMRTRCNERILVSTIGRLLPSPVA